MRIDATVRALGTRDSTMELHLLVEKLGVLAQTRNSWLEGLAALFGETAGIAATRGTQPQAAAEIERLLASRDAHLTDAAHALRKEVVDETVGGECGLLPRIQHWLGEAAPLPSTESLRILNEKRKLDRVIRQAASARADLEGLARREPWEWHAALKSMSALGAGLRDLALSPGLPHPPAAWAVDLAALHRRLSRFARAYEARRNAMLAMRLDSATKVYTSLAASVRLLAAYLPAVYGDLAARAESCGLLSKRGNLLGRSVLEDADLRDEFGHFVAALASGLAEARGLIKPVDPVEALEQIHDASANSGPRDTASAHAWRSADAAAVAFLRVQGASRVREAILNTNAATHLLGRAALLLGGMADAAAKDDDARFERVSQLLDIERGKAYDHSRKQSRFPLAAWLDRNVPEFEQVQATASLLREVERVHPDLWFSGLATKTMCHSGLLAMAAGVARIREPALNKNFSTNFRTHIARMLHYVLGSRDDELGLQESPAGRCFARTWRGYGELSAEDLAAARAPSSSAGDSVATIGQARTRLFGPAGEAAFAECLDLWTARVGPAYGEAARAHAPCAARAILLAPLPERKDHAWTSWWVDAPSDVELDYVLGMIGSIDDQQLFECEIYIPLCILPLRESAPRLKFFRLDASFPT